MVDLSLVAALASAAVSLAAVVAIFRHSPRSGRARALLKEAESQVCFLFDGDTLEDATPAARRMLPAARGRGDLDSLLRVLTPRFPGLRQAVAEIGQAGQTSISSTKGADWIALEYWDGFIRLTVNAEASEPGATGPGPMTLAAMESELETLRAVAEDSPQLIWAEDETGEITWANAAYLALEAARSGAGEETAGWPPAHVFGRLALPTEIGDRGRARVSVEMPGRDRPDWFDITTIRRGAGPVHFALDANAAVRAEQAQRHFVQTLSKTFADLATGLAIFDAERRMVMFNPALMELTGLPVDFLATRPLIHSFLDRLREQRMLPEPRDYRTWREEIAALEAEAADGTYCETWTLPGGQIYRVTGRPHPDGAVAFLMEDITAEMSLTRRFRSQIETASAVFDTLDEAIAVFGPSGVLTMTNAAYEAAWPRPGAPADRDGLEDGTVTVSDQRLRDEIEIWKSACVPTDIWQDIRTTAMAGDERRSWTGRVRRDDGRTMTCRVVPLPAGATMVSFRLPAEERGTSPLLPVPDRIAAHG